MTFNCALLSQSQHFDIVHLTIIIAHKGRVAQQQIALIKPVVSA